jgi:hypothetical protein
MIIKNVGWMWHRRFINWNRRKLIGFSSPGDRKENFANQSAIYALYNHCNSCVYIGLAGKKEQGALYDRMRTHAIDDRLFCSWERFSWFGFLSIQALHKQTWNDEWKITTDVEETMHVIEAVAIHVFRPNFNASWGNLRDVEWYYQKEEYQELIKPPPRNNY